MGVEEIMVDKLVAIQIHRLSIVFWNQENIQKLETLWGEVNTIEFSMNNPEDIRVCSFTMKTKILSYIDEVVEISCRNYKDRIHVCKTDTVVQWVDQISVLIKSDDFGVQTGGSNDTKAGGRSGEDDRSSDEVFQTWSKEINVEMGNRDSVEGVESKCRGEFKRLHAGKEVMENKSLMLEAVGVFESTAGFPKVGDESSREEEIGLGLSGKGIEARAKLVGQVSGPNPKEGIKDQDSLDVPDGIRPDKNLKVLDEGIGAANQKINVEVDEGLRGTEDMRVDVFQKEKKVGKVRSLEEIEKEIWEKVDRSSKHQGKKKKGRRLKGEIPQSMAEKSGRIVNESLTDGAIHNCNVNYSKKV